jgi:ABC-type dipeptide/oligopeptide/nickel transport system permease subunit
VKSDAAISGMLVGVISGYAGGLFNVNVMRITDAFLVIGNLLAYWWLYLPVTIFLILFVGVTWNLMGDRLDAIMNP